MKALKSGGVACWGMFAWQMCGVQSMIPDTREKKTLQVD